MFCLLYSLRVGQNLEKTKTKRKEIMTQKIIPAGTHVQITGAELDRLHRAITTDPENVFFARKVDDHHPWQSFLLISGPYSRGSDPMETSVSPICGYEDQTNWAKLELAIDGNSGEILTRKSKLGPQLGGWKPPIDGTHLFAWIPRSIQ